MISIIIPIYNTGKALIGMLDSVLAQTYRNFELILIDDGSTDGSSEICDRYVAEDSRVKVIHQSNAGVSAARNKGISLAIGNYIMFLDSDDCIDPNMLYYMIKAGNEYNADIVTCDLICNDEQITCKLEPNKLYEKHEVFTRLLPRFSYGNSIALFCPVNKLYKRSLLETHRIRFNEAITFQEDLMFTVTALACAQSLVYVPGGFYNYIQRSNGLCSSYRENSGEKFIYARKEFNHLIEKYAMVNLDINNFNIAFLYNISYFVYRTGKYVTNKQRKTQLINSTLTNPLTKEICINLSSTATSFDRRIASAIANGNLMKAIWLINLVHSGRTDKLQKLLKRIRN